MAENKTQKRDDLSVGDYLAALEGERRDDCLTIATMMQKLTGTEPHMFGTAIVGFGTYHYRYESGREGDAPVVGFSSRKGDISVYLMGGYEDAEAQELLARLGKHKVGKGCLYLPRLQGVDLAVLERLIARGRDSIKKQYG